MAFQRIDPTKLNSRQKEVYNFQKSAALLADYGFNCMKLADDWQGADFLAHHFDGKTTLKVQLKARLTIDRKYAGQDLWMNFPSGGTWYLVPHDELVEVVGQTTNWLNTASWRENGAYSSANPSPRLLQQLQPFAVEELPTLPAVDTTRPAAPAPAVSRGRTAATEPAARGRASSGNWRNSNLNEAAAVLNKSGYACSSPPIGMTGVDFVARRNDGTPAIKEDARAAWTSESDN